MRQWGVLGEARPGEVFQFERQGYFCADADHAHGRPVFNRTVTLRDTWEKIEQNDGLLLGAVHI